MLNEYMVETFVKELCINFTNNESTRHRLK